MMSKGESSSRVETEQDPLLPPPLGSTVTDGDADGYGDNGFEEDAVLHYDSIDADDQEESGEQGSAGNPKNGHHHHPTSSTCTRRHSGHDVVQRLEPKPMSIWVIVCILSTAFSYGCILTTLFLITLPVECERIEVEHSNIAKSVALGSFVAIAGVTQLVSPLAGKISDSFQPPPPHDIGQRLPFLILGSVMTVFGLLGELFASYRSFWLRYSIAFFAHMIGLNIMYAMMLAMIPDQVPSSQTGVANGILAGLLVTGSLFGFGLFHGFLRENVQDMYALYTCIVIVSTIATGIYGHDRDVEIALIRTQPIRQVHSRQQLQGQQQADNTADHHHHHHQNDPDSIINNPDSNNNNSQRPANGNEKRKTSRRRRIIRVVRKVTKKVVATPAIILRSMLITPFQNLSWKTLYQSYTLDMDKHRDFFWVTVSRLFYYCGMSVQTFFMYFLHDIIHLQKDPEGAVATLSIIGQIAGAFTCVPVGVASDKLFAGKRKPFVHFACFVLAGTTFAAIFARTMHGMVIIMIFLGGANGIYLTMDTSLAVDTLPKEFEDSENGSAQLLGIWGVAAFLGSALGPMIGGPLLYYVGRQEQNDDSYNSGTGDNETTAGYSLTGYAVVLSLASFYFLMSSTALRFIRK